MPRASSSTSIGVDGARHEADALGLFARDLLAEKQVVLGLGHSAQQRPDDCCVVTGGHAEAGVPVDQARIARDHRDVCEQRTRQPGAHCRAVDGRDDRLRAIDHVVDEVTRISLAEHAHAQLEVARRAARSARGRRRPRRSGLRPAAEPRGSPGHRRCHARPERAPACMTASTALIEAASRTTSTTPSPGARETEPLVAFEAFGHGVSIGGLRVAPRREARIGPSGGRLQPTGRAIRRGGWEEPPRIVATRRCLRRVCGLLHFLRMQARASARTAGVVAGC